MFKVIIARRYNPDLFRINHNKLGYTDTTHALYTKSTSFNWRTITCFNLVHSPVNTEGTEFAWNPKLEEGGDG